MLILRLVLFCTILQLLLGAYPSAKSCQHFQQNAYMKKFIGEGLVRQSPHSGIGQLHTSLHAKVDPSFVWYTVYCTWVYGILPGSTRSIFYIYIWIRRYKRKGSSHQRHAWKGWQRSDGHMGWQQGFHLASGWGQLFGFMCLAAAVGTLQLPDGSQAAAEIAKDLAVDTFVAQLWTAKLESQTIKITCIFLDFRKQYTSQCLRVQDSADYILSLSLIVSRAWPPTVHEQYPNNCKDFEQESNDEKLRGSTQKSIVIIST